MGRGRAIDTGAIARAAAAKVPSLTRVVWTDTSDCTSFLHDGLRRVARRPAESAGERASVACEPTEAEEPCLIIYTSGTTGRPKGTVHTHAGCLAQMGKELRYAFDVRPGEPFFWFTDIGWMMGPWELIGCLLKAYITSSN